MPLNDREHELLRLLELYIGHLEQSRNIDPSTVGPFDAMDAAVQRWLQLAIQCCIDLGDSLLAGLQQPEPARQKDVFSALARIGLIDESQAHRMEDLVDYRNALTHAYSSLQPASTWQVVNTGLEPLVRFGASVRSLQGGPA